MTHFYGQVLSFDACIIISEIQDGMTALMVASNNGKTDVVNLLIESKADVNAERLVKQSHNNY